MRTLIIKALLLLVLTAMVGCSTVQVSQDYDPEADLSLYGTWQWQDPVQASTGDIRIDNPLLDRRIRRAVETHLKGRNMILAREQPNFTLTYHLSIDQKIWSDTYNSSFGVGRYSDPWYGGFGTETRIRQYEESRLTIDIHSADSGDLLWRGVGVFRFVDQASPEAAAEDMQKTVDKILWQFPPGGRK